MYLGSTLLPPRNIKVKPRSVPVPLMPRIKPTIESGYPRRVWSNAGIKVIGVKFSSPKINAISKPRA